MYISPVQPDASGAGTYNGLILNLTKEACKHKNHDRLNPIPSSRIITFAPQFPLNISTTEFIPPAHNTSAHHLTARAGGMGGAMVAIAALSSGGGGYTGGTRTAFIVIFSVLLGALFLLMVYVFVCMTIQYCQRRRRRLQRTWEASYTQRRVGRRAPVVARADSDGSTTKRWFGRKSASPRLLEDAVSRSSVKFWQRFSNRKTTKPAFPFAHGSGIVLPQPEAIPTIRTLADVMARRSTEADPTVDTYTRHPSVLHGTRPHPATHPHRTRRARTRNIIDDTRARTSTHGASPRPRAALLPPAYTSDPDMGLALNTPFLPIAAYFEPRAVRERERHESRIQRAVRAVERRTGIVVEDVDPVPVYEEREGRSVNVMRGGLTRGTERFTRNGIEIIDGIEVEERGPAPAYSSPPIAASDQASDPRSEGRDEEAGRYVRRSIF